MPVIPIDSIDDPRVLPYRDLPRSRLPRAAGLFIAEGRLLVERLLASDYEVDSVFVDGRHEEAVVPLVPAGVPVLVARKGLVEQIVGFNFHRGVLACGRRRPLRRLGDAVPAAPSRATVAVCVDVQDPENLGGLLRNCAAFGVDAVLLSPQCTDPFSRRVLRVSMGAVLRLVLVQSRDLLEDLHRLRRQAGFQLAATVLQDGAERLGGAWRPERFALLFGNEASGLGQQWREASDRRITIPMRPGTDSLNVAVASGIFLYHFTRKEAFQQGAA